MENRNTTKAIAEIMDTHRRRMREFPAAPNQGMEPARLGEPPRSVAGGYVGQRPAMSFRDLGIPTMTRAQEPEDLTRQ
jgi:hypothetical protein